MKSIGEILYEAGQDAERNAQIQNEQNQRQLQIDRSQTHSMLLPLVASNTSVSRETQGIILSSLQRSLEMDSGGTVTNWRNSNTGSNGDIRVHSESKNRFGDVCRDFYVSLYSPDDKQTRSINGTGCRSNGRWNLMSGSQQQQTGFSSPSCTSDEECGSGEFCYRMSSTCQKR